MTPLRKSIIPASISNQNDGGKDIITHTGGLLIFTSYAMMISPFSPVGIDLPTTALHRTTSTPNCRVTYKKMF